MKSNEHEAKVTFNLVFVLFIAQLAIAIDTRLSIKILHSTQLINFKRNSHDMITTYNNEELADGSHNVGEEQPQEQEQQQKASGTWQQLTTVMRNAKSRTAYGKKNAMEAMTINKLKSGMTACKKNFGVAYMDLLMNGASVTELEACVTKAVEDLSTMKAKLVECEEIIAYNKERLERKISARRGELGANQSQQPAVHEEGPFTTEPIHLIHHGGGGSSSSSSSISSSKENYENANGSEVVPAFTFATTSASSPPSSPCRDEGDTTLQNKTMSTASYTNEDSLPFDESTSDQEEDKKSIHSSVSHPSPSAPFQAEEEREEEIDVAADEVEWARGVERPTLPPIEPTIY